MSATVRMTSVTSRPSAENFSTSRGHCFSSCDGASTSVALVGIAFTGFAIAFGSGNLISLARIAPIVMAVLPYPTWSAMMPPRTSRSTRARPSIRNPSAGWTLSATSSSTNGSVVCSWRIIHPSERSCSGRSGNFVFHPLGCGALASLRLDLRVKSASATAASRSSCLTTCHSTVGLSSACGAALRSFATPLYTFASARCASVAGLTAMTSSPSFFPAAAAVFLHWTTKGAGRRFSACSYAAACRGSSLAVILLSPALHVHWRTGGDGAQRGHASGHFAPPHAFEFNLFSSSVVNDRTSLGSASRDVNHASLWKTSDERSF
mmetsp:Transcript_4312/g.15195  ORF Transcript_4312/g.15195 Transcript_4312/m.15195 type:complete len:321 (+) Transcript_4312:140-1102(+)